MKNTNLIPSTFNCGGQPYEVRRVERCDNNSVGEACYCGGYVEIADLFDKNVRQSDGSKINTFFHELTHIILDNMGKKELSRDEEFVCTFAGFLTEAMTTAQYEPDEIAKMLKEMAGNELVSIKPEE